MNRRDDQLKRTSLCREDESNEPELADGTDTNLDSSKRQFLTGAGHIAGAAAAAGVVGVPAVSALPGAEAEAAGFGSDGLWVKDGRRRRNVSFAIRIKAAAAERKRRVLGHPTNGDEERYWGTFIGNFSKTLPHFDNGEVVPEAYIALLNAMETGRFEDFEAIPAGGFFPLANPMGGLAFTVEGPDTAAIAVEPPPALASPEFAAQLAELYWMACLRNVPFSQYDSHPRAIAARSDLASMAGYTGPRSGPAVGSQDLFRYDYPGARTGPMVSQFLYRPFDYDGITVEPKIEEPDPAQDFMTDFASWLAAQRGLGGFGGIPTTGSTVYPRTARDLGKIAGSDTINSTYFRAALVLGFFGPTDPGNPYGGFGGRQFAFATFGFAHLVELIGKVHKSERHAWFTKWCVTRFLRPEAAGGRVHQHKTGNASYPLDPDILGSPALDCISEDFGSYLLPQMFPTGGPPHPSFTAGHAISAGACVTVLKAWFDEDAGWPFPAVEPSDDGQSLLPYAGGDLTVGGELNKLAHNLSAGRDMSGVHWRADDIEGNKQGEELAIRLLREEKRIFPEPFEGFTLTKFDGETITI